MEMRGYGMDAEKLKQIIQDCCNDISFVYNGKPSGIAPEVYDSIPTYTVWYGEDTKIYHDAEDVMTDKFYSGMSLAALADKIQFNIE